MTRYIHYCSKCKEYWIGDMPYWWRIMVVAEEFYDSDVFDEKICPLCLKEMEGLL